jgi:hypothetical protein
MIEWQVIPNVLSPPFLSRSIANVRYKRYTRKEIRSMMLNIEKLVDRKRQKNKELLRLILLDLVIIYSITE